MAVDERPPVLEGPGDEPARPAGLGVLGWARWGWRQLTSMRTALLLLLLLAVAAVPGSVLPQRGVTQTGVDAFRADYPRLAPVVDALGGFDVYASPWFAAIYLLLFTSLVGCVVPRALHHWRASRSGPPRTPARLERLPVHRRAEVAAPPDEVAAAAAAALRGRRYRVEVRPDGSVAAERGYLRETGNLLFHLSLIGVLVAVAWGGLSGYRGEAMLVEDGEGWSNVIPQYSSFTRGVAVDATDLEPFSLDLERLGVRFEESTADPSQLGAPRGFAADVVVTAASGAQRRQVVRVNQPLTVAGTRLFLSGNGYAPVVTVRDSTGTVAFSGPVPFLPQDGQYTSIGVVKVPDAVPEGVGLQGLFLPTAVFDQQQGPVSVFPDARDPRLVLNAWVGDLGLDRGAAQSVFVLDTAGMRQLRTPDGEQSSFALRPGETAELPEGAGTVTFESLPRFAVLKVSHDPGRGLALVSAALALAGLVLSLFVPRRRIWVRARAGGLLEHPRTVVDVGGLSRGDDAGLAAEVERVCDGTTAAGT